MAPMSTDENPRSAPDCGGKNRETSAASGKAEEIVVFITRRGGKCAECGAELSDGSMIVLERNQPHCLDCADLGHLEYLPRGDTALTRRATKHSPLRAVVLQWSRTRQHYERQGILVTGEAIARAEQECLADAELRVRQRERAAIRREAGEEAYETAVTTTIRAAFPGCPAEEAARIAAWTCRKHSGRVGRSAAAKDLDPVALRLAVIAHIRHEHTDYDRQLMRTGDRQAARQTVRGEIDRVLARWEAPRDPTHGHKP
jgi:hypothetical protein